MIFHVKKKDHREWQNFDTTFLIPKEENGKTGLKILDVQSAVSSFLLLCTNPSPPTHCNQSRNGQIPRFSGLLSEGFKPQWLLHGVPLGFTELPTELFSQGAIGDGLHRGERDRREDEDPCKLKPLEMRNCLVVIRKSRDRSATRPPRGLGIPSIGGKSAAEQREKERREVKPLATTLARRKQISSSGY